MKKRITLLTAIILCVAMMFSFAACSSTGEEEAENEFVAATIPVDANVPVSESEIIAFYNDIITKLQDEDMFDATNKPGVKLNESLSVDNINILALNTQTGEATESDTLTTLNKSAKAIKDRVLGGIKTASTTIAFGDMNTPVSTVIYPYTGDSNLKAENIVKANCSVDGSKMNISIVLKGNIDTVNNVFGTRDKTEVLAAINEQSKAYATVNDYSVEYVADEETNTYSYINLVVEVAEDADGNYECTGRIMSLDIKVICDVAADMTCAGSFADYGDVQVQFRFTDEKYYEFDWLGTATWEPTATEEVSE